MSSIVPKISDFGRHSNVKPRPLGAVKAESACFDFLGSNNRLITHTFESAAGDIDRRQLIMNRLHENLISTVLIADASSVSDHAEPNRKGGNVRSSSFGPNFSAMHLLSSLVSPRPRTISIPKQRDFQAYDLRISTAPNISPEMDGTEVFDLQGDASYGHHQTSDWNLKNSPRHTANWGEYRRQLSTAKKKELTRKLSQISKCEAVDIMDPIPRFQSHTSPMIIMSQSQRDAENEILNAAADALLQRSRRSPLVFSAGRKRSRTIIRETGVFSRSLKMNNSQQQTGQLPDGIIGRNIHSGFGLAPDGSLGEDFLFTGRAGGSSRLWRRHVSYQDRVQPPKDRPNSKQKEVNVLSGHTLQSRSARTTKDGLFKLQGKSLPRLPKQNSYTENLRLLQKKKQEGQLPTETRSTDSLPQSVHSSMSQVDKFWMIPEALSEVENTRSVTNGFRAPRKLPTKLPPYNETLHAQNLLYTRNKSPSYSNIQRDVPSPRKEGKCDKNSICCNTTHENTKDDDLHGTFRLTELREDDIMDVDSDGSDLTDSDEDAEDRLLSARFGDEDLTRQPLDVGKYQGTTSRISDYDAGNQFHLVNGENASAEEESYKILKALDKDVYLDYEHKKYRKSGTAGSARSYNSRKVHFLKVKVNKPLT